MFQALNVAGVVPAEPLLPLDDCCHGLDPERVLHCLQSSVLCFFDCFVSCIITLERVTAGADTALHQSKLGPCLAFPGWQAVAQPRHLACFRKAVCYFNCVFYFHNLSFLILYYTSRLATCQRLRLEACRLKLGAWIKENINTKL